MGASFGGTGVAVGWTGTRLAGASVGPQAVTSATTITIAAMIDPSLMGIFLPSSGWITVFSGSGGGDGCEFPTTGVCYEALVGPEVLSKGSHHHDMDSDNGQRGTERPLS
jgi:hypothetical protein